MKKYVSKQDIQDSYGWGIISESEMDRLNALWDARESSLAAAGKYEDRVTQMLERTLNAVGDEFTDQLFEFDEQQRRMEADAERIAKENIQREWEREHGGGISYG